VTSKGGRLDSYNFSFILARFRLNMVVMNEISYNPIPFDTSAEAARVQDEIYRNMSMSQRAELTFKLCDNLRNTVKDGIRDRHPDYTEDMVTQAYLNSIMDKDFVKEAFGSRELEP